MGVIVDPRGRVIGGSPFAPDLRAVLGSWLRNDTLSGGIASVSDILNPSNPAAQATSGLRPTGNADGSIGFGGAHVLAWPLITANNNRDTIGYYTWINPASFVGNPIIWCANAVGGGASANKLTFRIFGDGSLQLFYYTTTLFRLATVTGNPLSTGTKYFVGFEFDSGAGSEAAGVNITIGGVVQTISFSNTGSYGQLAAVTGSALIGNQATNGAGNAITATYGRDSWVLNGKMAGATRLLTPTGLAALMNYEPL